MSARERPDAGTPGALAPMSRPLPWQARPWSELVTMAAGGRLPHGLLLEAKNGTGRLDFGIALARYLLCEAPTEAGNCGECRNCLHTASGAHGDLRQLLPEEKGRAIGIDAVRSAIDFVHGSATRGQRKVLLVYPANAMTTAAFNAFLKCLEEPSPGTHIVMLSTVGHALPATIRSRCQRWSLGKPSKSEATQWLDTALREEPELTADLDASSLLALCNDQPLDALALARDGSGEALTKVAARLTEGGLSSAHQLADTARLAAGVEPERFLDLLENRLQRALRAMDGAALRAASGRQALAALDEVQRLRAAQRSGSNPNGDLLRISALSACCGLWAK